MDIFTAIYRAPSCSVELNSMIGSVCCKNIHLCTKKRLFSFSFISVTQYVCVFTVALHPCQAPYQNKAMQGQAIWGLALFSANKKLWFLAQNCWSLTPNSFHVCPFTRPGMGRIWAWSLLCKAIVAGFLCWLHPLNTLLHFAVSKWLFGAWAFLLAWLTWYTYYLFTVLLIVSQFIWLIFFYNQCGSSVTFLTLACDHLLELQLFGPSVIAESRPKVPLFAVTALEQRVYFGKLRLSVFLAVLFRAMMGSAFCHHYILPCPSCGWFYQKQKAFL